MRHKYEVEALVKRGPYPPEYMEHATVYEEFYTYDYVHIYSGTSLTMALKIMRRAKKWSTSVRFTWR